VINRTEPTLPEAKRTLAARLAHYVAAIRPIYVFTRGYEETQRQLIYDLEVLVRLLNLREFADWLRVHGDATQSQFSAEIHDALDDSEALETLDAQKAAQFGEYDELVDRVRLAANNGDSDFDALHAVEELDGAATTYREVRQTLVECGALDANDTETSVPDLIRALLS